VGAVHRGHAKRHGRRLCCTRKSVESIEPIPQIGNGSVAADLALEQGARRENTLYGSLTDEQRRCSGKDLQPSGLSSGRPLTALLLSHRAHWLCSFVAPCQPPARV